MYTQAMKEKVDRIVKAAERQYEEGEYGDMAYDAVMADPECDEMAVATRLAMAHAFP